MATRRSGSVRVATTNSVTSAARSADDFGYGSYCRWADCDYEHITAR